jgi:hypothetical protein
MRYLQRPLSWWHIVRSSPLRRVAVNVEGEHLRLQSQVAVADLMVAIEEHLRARASGTAALPRGVPPYSLML